MTAQLLAGAPVAQAVLEEVRLGVEQLKARGLTPGLGTILVGADASSARYVQKKHETTEQVGMASFHIDVPADAGQPALRPRPTTPAVPKSSLRRLVCRTRLYATWCGPAPLW